MDTKVLKEVLDHFGGRDPIAEVQIRMNDMGKAQLKKLVLVAGNHIGMLLKGEEEYQSPQEAAIHLGMGVDIIINAYDSASMQMKSTTGTIGTA